MQLQSPLLCQAPAQEIHLSCHSRLLVGCVMSSRASIFPLESTCSHIARHAAYSLRARSSHDVRKFRRSLCTPDRAKPLSTHSIPPPPDKHRPTTKLTMLNSQVAYSVHQHCIRAIVVVVELVGNVSMDKDLSWFTSEDDGLRYTRVGTW
jgi:hypothetical protein